MSVQVLNGDCRDVLRTLPDQSVNCIVTSPPYFGLRDYGVDGQIGLEPTPAEFVAELVAVFREARRVLRDDGTLWLNLGDSYASIGGGYNEEGSRGKASVISPKTQRAVLKGRNRSGQPSLKPKDLIGIPWMVAKALQAPFYTGRIKNETDRVWLAAMIDGEGCMFIHKRKIGQNNGQGYARKSATYGAGLEVANTSLAIIERCMAITGVGSVVRQEKDRRQPLYRWNVRSNECRWIIEEVYPHLVGKQHQARLLLGCPSSGEMADKAHQGLIALHNGIACDVDFAPPKPLWEPGWYLRQDIIWSKSNPMPESVLDRCTKSHEYLFLLSKRERYLFDAQAIAEPLGEASIARLAQDVDAQQGSDRVPGKTNGPMKAVGGRRAAGNKTHKGQTAYEAGENRFRTKAGLVSFAERERAKVEAGDLVGTRNKRSVWTVATQPFRDAHFATFPPDLIRPCIMAGCPLGGTVLDPFGGAGTTGLVADRLQRNAILIELNPAYAEMTRNRLAKDAGLFGEIA